MLALVTCHIFPPSIWYGKKEFLAPDFPADSSQFFRVHESTASRVRSGRCSRQCATLFHGQMYLQEKTPVLQFGHTLEQNSSICPIISYLWMVDLVMRFFFLWGQPLKIIHKNSAKKRSSPLDFIFDTCASASSSHLFLVGEAEHMWLYPFARTNAFSAKKHMFCNLGALTQNSWIRPIMSYLWMIGLEMRFFSCGPTFEDYPQVFSQKRSSPLDFIFDPCALASWSHLFGWWRWTYVIVPFCKVM